MGPAVAELVKSVAAYGVGLPGAAILDSPLDRGGWARLLDEVRRERITGLLHAAIADGAVATTSGQAAEAAESHAEDMCEAVVLERVLLDSVDLLSRSGVECRVLKGPAVAHLDYPRPELRSFIDVDLLVRSEQLEAAVKVLGDAGCRRRFAELRPGFDRRFTKAVSFRTPSQRDLDLHRTLAPGPFGLCVDLDLVWEASSPFGLGGRTVSALAPISRFGNACLHAVLGDFPPRLVPLRDVAQMASAGKIAVEDVHHLADSWRAGVVVSEALTSSWRTLGLEPDLPLVSWARRYRASRWEQRALGVYQRAEASYGSKARAAVGIVPGWRNKLAYVGALAFPQASYIRASNGSHLERWWRTGRDIGRDLARRKPLRTSPRAPRPAGGRGL